MTLIENTPDRRVYRSGRCRCVITLDGRRRWLWSVVGPSGTVGGSERTIQAARLACEREAEAMKEDK